MPCFLLQGPRSYLEGVSTIELPDCSPYLDVRGRMFQTFYIFFPPLRLLFLNHVGDFLTSLYPCFPVGWDGSAQFVSVLYLYLDLLCHPWFGSVVDFFDANVFLGCLCDRFSQDFFKLVDVLPCVLLW